MSFPPAILFFEHAFFGIVDVAFLVVYLVAIRTVRGTRWDVHLGWLMPWTIGCGLSLAYRTILNLHYFMGLHLSAAVSALGLTFLYVANGFDLWGAVVLCRTLKRLVADDAIGRLASSALPTVEEGVWPPPPLPPG